MTDSSRSRETPDYSSTGPARWKTGTRRTEEEDDRDDEEEGKIVIQKELIGNTDEIIAAAFLPRRDGSKHGSTSDKLGDGKPLLNALAVATNSSLLRVFDPSTMSCTAALTGHSGAILSLDVAGWTKR